MKEQQILKIKKNSEIQIKKNESLTIHGRVHDITQIQYKESLSNYP
jgi:hypothetical protein